MCIKIKPLSALLILIALVSQITAFAAPSNEEAESYEEAVRVVSQLGIMPETDKTDSSLTRAELVVTVLRFLNMAHLLSEYDTLLFNDVSNTHKAFREIHMGFALGIIGEAQDGKFYPDREATYPEAVKMIMCALGYAEKAEVLGGYPTGYFMMASQCGVLQKVSYNNSGPIPRYAVAELLYNALEAEVLARSFETDHKYYTETGKTILSLYHNIGIARGVVIQNGRTGLYTAEGLRISDQSVVIGAETYGVGQTDIHDYLGYHVKIYYENDENSKHTIKFYSVMPNNIVVEIDLDQLEDIDYVNGALILDYSEGGGSSEPELQQPVRNGNASYKVKKLTSSISSCIYNNKSVALSDIPTEIIPRLAEAKTGSIKLIDNTGDENYDVAIVRVYHSYLVQRVNTHNTSIACIRYTPSGSLLTNILSLFDERREIEFNLYDQNGNIMEMNYINGKDVISVFESIDQSAYDIYVTNRRVVGAITEISDRDEYTINGKIYKRGHDFPSELLSVGMNSVFYLDIGLDIVGIDPNNAVTGSYGLLMDVFIPNNTSLQPPQYRILKDNGEFVTLESEEKITAYNPASGNVESVAVSSLVCTERTPRGYGTYKHMLWYTQNQNNFTFETAVNQPQNQFYYRPWLTTQDKSNIASRKPVYYKTNSKGKITTIIVPDIPVEGHNKIKTINPESRYSFVYMSAASRVRDINAGTTSTDLPFVNLSTDAIVYDVTALDYTEKDYRVSVNGISSLRNGASSKYVMYSIEDSEKARLVVNYNALPSEALYMPYVVVRSVGVSSDGALKLYGYSKGERFEAEIEPSTRLVERFLSSDRNAYNEATKVKAANLLDFCSTKPDGTTGNRCFDLALTLNSNTWSQYSLGPHNPFVDENTLRKGDIVFVGKNRGNKICYVEVVMRAQDSVFLPNATQSTYINRMTSGTMTRKAVVTGLYEDREVIVRSVGEYSAAANRLSAPYVNNRDTSSMDMDNTDYILSYLYDDRDVPYDFSNCNSVWIYDYKRSAALLTDHTSIEIGDSIMIRGSSTNPYDCVILRNYPNEADFNYWTMSNIDSNEY